MKIKGEKFEAVNFMRAKREELSTLHKKNPKAYKKQLEEVRRKYSSKLVMRKRSEA